nr:unnamed protein product [Digitaria exilis]
MRGGRRRLRIAPVGEIRRRWAGVLASNREEYGGKGDEGEYEGDKEGDWEGEGSDESEVEWSTPDNSLRDHADPLKGLRPGGTGSRFCGIGEEQSTENSMPSPPVDSPSVFSMIRRVQAAGCSIQELKEADEVLVDPSISEKACAMNTPPSIEPSVKLVRKVVKALIDGRHQKPAAGIWHGPVPPPRSSPPLTLGDVLSRIIVSFVKIIAGGSLTPTLAREFKFQIKIRNQRV